MFWFLAKLLLWLVLTGLVFFVLGWLFRSKRAITDIEKFTSDLMDEQQRHRESKLRLKEVSGREGDYKTEIARRKNQHAEIESSLMKTRQERDEALKQGGGSSGDQELVALKMELDKSRQAHSELKSKFAAVSSGEAAGSGDAQLAKITAERDQLKIMLKSAREKASAAKDSGTDSGTDDKALQAIQSDLKKVTAERDQLATNLEKAQETAEITAHGQSDLESITAERNQLVTKLEQLENTAQAASATQDELTKLTAERDQLAANLKKAKDATQAASATQDELAKLTAERDQLAANLKKAKDATQAASATQDELAKLTAERDQLAANLKKAKDATQAASATQDELAKLTAERDQLAANLKEAKDAAQAASATQDELAKLTAERDQLAASLKDAEDTAHAATAGQNKLEKVSAERDQLKLLLKETREKASASDAPDQKAVSALQSKNEELEAELKKMKASTASREGAKNEEVAILKNNLITANNKITELQKLESAGDETAKDIEQMKRALDLARDRIEELENEPPSSQGEFAFGAGGAAAGLMAGAAGTNAITDEALLAERNSLKAQLDTLKDTLAASAEYASGTKQADDLTEISGIGPGLSAKLNSFGIYTYRQIAEWESTSIEAFDALLSFPGRIKRDKWQTQAQQLNLEKYGPA